VHAVSQHDGEVGAATSVRIWRRGGADRFAAARSHQGRVHGMSTTPERHLLDGDSFASPRTRSIEALDRVGGRDNVWGGGVKRFAKTSSQVVRPRSRPRQRWHCFERWRLKGGSAREAIYVMVWREVTSPSVVTRSTARGAAWAIAQNASRRSHVLGGGWSRVMTSGRPQLSPK